MDKRMKVFNLTKGRCFYCGYRLNMNNFHLDHFIAKSKGGGGGDNYVPTCPTCNISKGNLSLEEFRAKIAGLPMASNQGRMITRFYDIDIDKEIKFWFEREHNDGEC